METERKSTEEVPVERPQEHLAPLVRQHQSPVDDPRSPYQQPGETGQQFAARQDWLLFW